ncbi:hypothetical protein D3C78_1296440 [compost metagenome]
MAALSSSTLLLSAASTLASSTAVTLVLRSTVPAEMAVLPPLLLASRVTPSVTLVLLSISRTVRSGVAPL